MTVLAVAAVLTVWCFAATVVGLVLCRAIHWAQGLDALPGRPPTATAPAAAAPGAPPTALPAQRTSDEQLDVSALARGSGELVEP